MSAFRTCRPLLVDATQAKEPGTVAIDIGIANVRRGDWIVRGEDGECYVVDDSFFQRTFVEMEGPAWMEPEPRNYGC